MTAIEDRLADLAVLDDLPAGTVGLLARLGRERAFDPDDRLFTMDAPADTFHIVVSGLVAIEVVGPGSEPVVIETIGPGDLVGISWLLPPHRWVFTARAIEPTETVAIDAVELRRRCDEDPVLGYHLHRRVAGVIHHRLMATRLRVLDLYGPRR
jgi:CRP-like cAMP-binding protein